MASHVGSPIAARVSTLLVIATSGGLTAGAQRDIGAIRGQVVDARSLAPISGAVVVLAARPDRPAIADSGGRFEHSGLAADTHRIEARAPGYAPRAWTVVVREGETLNDLRLELHPREYELPAIEATADTGTRNRGLREFERRRASGLGIFVTPEEIERRRPVTIGDIMRLVPGVTTACDRVTGCYLRMVRAPRGCPAEVFVDGVSATLVIQAETSATDVLAVEVYRSPSETPSEFSRIERTCGTILIWTHAGHMERQ